MTDDERKKKLSFAIFWAMWQLGISPPRLAGKIGKSADTVRRWRDGESAPNTLDLAPLAEALQVKVKYFTHPPDVPPYPFDDYREFPSDAESLIAEAVASGVEEGKRRARRPREVATPSKPRLLPPQPSRVGGKAPR